MNNMLQLRRHDGNIFKYMNDFERSFFNSNFKSAPMFRCDISDKDNVYLIEAELPGFEKENIQIEVNENVLTISASSGETSEKNDQNGNYIRRERHSNKLSRSFTTDGINLEEVSASYKNGVLRLSLPKTTPSEPQTKKIEISD